MKNHNQMCGLSVAIDQMGDRWTLLIVRELLVSPRSFTELQNLTGSSPRLLADRLKVMIQNGLINQADKVPKKRAIYRLTELGSELREPIESLVRWGGRLIPLQKGHPDKQPHWLEIAVPALIRPKLKEGSCFKIQFSVDGHEFAISANNFNLDIIRGKSDNPDIYLQLTYEKTLALVSGYFPIKSLTCNEARSPKYPTKAALTQRLQDIWCGRRDSNSHAVKHTTLNRACLPIPPRPHNSQRK